MSKKFSNYEEYLKSKEYKKAERRQKYLNEDVKHGKIIIDNENETVKFVNSKEDSLNRLYEEGYDFEEDLNLEYRREHQKEISTLYQALNMLADAERELITQIFFLKRTAKDISLDNSISNASVHRQKEKILKKLKEIIEGLEKSQI